MNSTPHTADGEHTQSGDENKGYWLSEHPEQGLERNWTKLGHPYTVEAADRERIAAAINNVRWHRLGEAVPFSPGRILQVLILEAQRNGLRPLAVGIGPDPIDYPEPHLLDQPRKTGYLIALRQLARSTTFSVYFLVLNDEVGTAVLDIDDRPLPEGRLTEACAARLHELCKGAIDGFPCECPCGKAGPRTS